MHICVPTRGQRSPWSHMFVLAAVVWPIVLVCSSVAVAEKATEAAPRSVEDINTNDEAAAFLQRALPNAQRDSRTIRELPVAKAAQKQAVGQLNLAIQWLEGKTAIKPSKDNLKKREQEEKTLLGIWRHRLNSDGTENLMIFGPEKTFVAVRGVSTWVGNWERRGDLLYMQNDRGDGDSYADLGLPSIQRITKKEDGSIDLKSVAYEDHPGFSLTRIK